MVTTSSLPAIYKKSSLRAVCRLVERKTVLAERYHESPIKITKTFREPVTDGLMLYMMDVSPGLMEGDHYEVDVRLEAVTHLTMTNQSFTKVHPATSVGAMSHYQFHIGPQAILEYMPEPTIPYKDSRLQARNVFYMDEDASLLYAEITTPGRTHRDERFEYEQLSMTTEVFRNNKRVAFDHFLLNPQLHRHTAVGALEQYTHQGTFWIFSTNAGDTLLQSIRELISTFDSSVLLAGASLAPSQGISVRMLGRTVWELQELCNEIWICSRQHLWQYPACQMRK